MFAAIQPYLLAIKLGLVVVLCAALFYAGWHARGTHDVAATISAQKQAVVIGNKQNAADSAAAIQHEQARVQIEYRDRIVTQKVAVDAQDYHGCQLKPADLSLLNQAIDGGAQ